MISSGAYENPSGHGSPAKWKISESEGPRPSEIFPRRGKMNVPARSKSRQDPPKTAGLIKELTLFEKNGINI